MSELIYNTLYWWDLTVQPPPFA